MNVIRKLKKIKLLNVALTAIPMNPGAVITDTFMKSLETMSQGREEREPSLLEIAANCGHRTMEYPFPEEPFFRKKD